MLEVDTTTTHNPPPSHTSTCWPHRGIAVCLTTQWSPPTAVSDKRPSRQTRGAAGTSRRSALPFGGHALRADTGDDVAEGVAEAGARGASPAIGAAARLPGASPPRIWPRGTGPDRALPSTRAADGEGGRMQVLPPPPSPPWMRPRRTSGGISLLEDVASARRGRVDGQPSGTSSTTRAPERGSEEEGGTQRRSFSPCLQILGSQVVIVYDTLTTTAFQPCPSS